MTDRDEQDRMSQREKELMRSVNKSRDLMRRVGRGERIVCEKCGTPLKVLPEGPGPYITLFCEKRCTYAHINLPLEP